MEHVKDFFITNFPLIIIAIGMICVALYDFKVRKRASSYVLGIIFVALLLAVFLEIEHVGSQTLILNLNPYVSKPHSHTLAQDSGLLRILKRKEQDHE